MKAKKVLAMLMASAMIMGTTVTAFAVEGTAPSEDDYKTATVSNVETGATVTAYQVVDAVYNDYGFIGYDVVKDATTKANLVDIDEPTKPTSSEIATIADKINSVPSFASQLTQKTMTDTDGDGTYTADLEAGYWLVLVRTTGTTSTNIYNPILVGVNYSKGGNNNDLYSDPVGANESWTLVTKGAWAKSSEIPFTKTADSETEDLGDDVSYTIATTVPSYGPEYKTVTFEISDSLTGLELTDDEIEVINVNGAGIEDDEPISNEVYSIDYTIADDGETKTGFEVAFSSDWIKLNGGTKIEIRYTATLTNDALMNEDAHTNDATLKYTNNPGTTTGEKKDTEKVYTFDIDGEITGDILKKVQPGEDANTKTALKDAQFTLYKTYDEKTGEVSEPYRNANHTSTPTAISDANGKIQIKGLAAGTYYLKETQAPNEFTLNNTVYKIEINPTFNGEELESWDVNVTDMTTGDKAENGFTVSGGNATAEQDNQITEIMNTKISSLPSTGGIGTTIFTIGGCAIMVTAAGLYFATRKKEQN